MTLQDSAIGAFDDTVQLQPGSVSGFGPNVAFLPSELRLIGSVAAIPESDTYVLTLAGGLMVLVWARRRHRQVA